MEQRTFNTALQGQALIAATNGLDIRALDFTSALKQLPAMTGTNNVAESKLYVNDLVQSSVGHLLVNATGYLYLGPDTADQASNYMSLFNLQDTSDVRVLDFVKVSASTIQGCFLANDSVNTTPTANHVTVNNLSNSLLFGAFANPGTHRLVAVQKVSDVKVNFTVLPGCCNDLNVD